MSDINKEDLKNIQDKIKALSPSAKDDESVPIHEIQTHCAGILQDLLNLEWLNTTAPVARQARSVDVKIDKGAIASTPSRNQIAVRIERLDMPLSVFVNKARDALKRIE